MTGGAGWKMAPHMSVHFELVESLIFDGLLVIAQRRLLRALIAALEGGQLARPVHRLEHRLARLRRRPARFHASVSV